MSVTKVHVPNIHHKLLGTVYSGKAAAVSFALNPFHLKHITSVFHNVLLHLVVMINGYPFSSNPVRGKKNLNSLCVGGVV
jgi:hypothetical protein